MKTFSLLQQFKYWVRRRVRNKSLFWKRIFSTETFYWNPFQRRGLKINLSTGIQSCILYQFPTEQSLLFFKIQSKSYHDQSLFNNFSIYTLPFFNPSYPFTHLLQLNILAGYFRLYIYSYQYTHKNRRPLWQIWYSSWTNFSFYRVQLFIFILASFTLWNKSQFHLNNKAKFIP